MKLLFMACLVVAATFVLFMTGLRVTHNAFHRTLGLSRRSGDVVGRHTDCRGRRCIPCARRR